MTWFVAAKFAQSVTTNPESTLVQYGALGLIALLMAVAVRTLFRRETEAHDRERARSDMLFGKLEEVNKANRDSIVAFSDALKTVGHAMQAISDVLARQESATTRRRHDDYAP